MRGRGAVKNERAVNEGLVEDNVWMLAAHPLLLGSNIHPQRAMHALSKPSLEIPFHTS